MTGYTRQDTTNSIADGNIIDPDIIDSEYDAIEGAFDVASGHTHDGSASEGAPITVIGPSQDVVAEAAVLRPKTDDTVSLGTVTYQYKDAYFKGTVTAADVAISGGTITGITDLAVADGGTGASTTAGARTNLGLGTAATEDIPATGDAAVGEVVIGSDTRLTDARTPTSHTHTVSDITDYTAIDTSNVTITGGSITGITDLAIADGGTGASTAPDARTNLGLGTAATKTAQTSSTDTTADRAMLNGAGGWHGTVAATANDADTATYGGFFMSSDLSTATNWPSWFTSGPGALQVIPSQNSNNFVQIAVELNSHALAVRTYRAGAFNVAGWQKVAFEGNDADFAGLTADSAVITTDTNPDAGDYSDDRRGALILSNVGGTQGDGNLGSALSFTGINTTRRRAMIASYQDGSDPDVIGLKFFIHGSTAASTDAVSEVLKLGPGGVTGKFLELQETAVSISGTTPSIDLETGTYFYITTSGNTTFSFTNPAASGTVSQFTLEVTAGGTHTLYWPAAVDTENNVALDTPASGEVYTYVFTTRDGGATWLGYVAGRAMG